MKIIPNKYKVPKSWKQALQKGCIKYYDFRADMGYVEVHLAPGYYTTDLSLTLKCPWDKSLPEVVNHPPQMCHWDSALDYLISYWSEIVQIQN